MDDIGDAITLPKGLARASAKKRAKRTPLILEIYRF
jgi:hypothetical protein